MACSAETELEKKNSMYIHFTVSSASQAVRILERDFNTSDFHVDDDYNLRLYDTNIMVASIIRRFIESGIDVSEAHTQNDTLEDYFKILKWYLPLFPIEDALTYIKPYLMTTPACFGTLAIYAVVSVCLTVFIYKRKIFIQLQQGLVFSAIQGKEQFLIMQLPVVCLYSSC